MDATAAWIQTHLPEFIIVGLFGLFRFFGGREIKRMDADVTSLQQYRDAHETRLRLLESDRVTRKDFDELRMSLTASIVHAIERVEALFEKRDYAATKSRHDQANILQSILTKVAVLEHQANRNND